MKNNLKDRVANCFELNDDRVWIAKSAPAFGYSDGVESERYLRRVFAEATDLSSTSHELERWIKDWPSEYHLSRKRAQLLRGLSYRRSDRVLEVGCGCGAITRFLGETFDDVLAIEGSAARAGIARMRTRDLDNVTIVSAPYQEVEFTTKFDVIFCIGVLEYAGMFVPGEDPYAAIVKQFGDLLTPNGQLVLAIENQFGLKYFTTSREDHTNRMFEGIEGYPLFGTQVRTFGYGELRDRLLATFREVEFMLPFPDYKIPSCVLSERMTRMVATGELVGSLPSRDYIGELQPLFDESLALRELDRNGQIPFFSNSFLVVASKSDARSVVPAGLGVMFSDGRAPGYCTTTRFELDPEGGVWSNKLLEPVAGMRVPDESPLRFIATRDRWVNGTSLQRRIIERTSHRSASLGILLEPCRAWLAALQPVITQADGRHMLPGAHLDAIWRNAFFDGEVIRFIDQEWEWHAPIPLNVLFIRAAFCLLAQLPRSARTHPAFASGNSRALIHSMGQTLGLRLEARDFEEFLQMEGLINAQVRGVDAEEARRRIRLFLWSRQAHAALKRVASWGRKVGEQVARGRRFGARVLQRFGA